MRSKRARRNILLSISCAGLLAADGGFRSAEAVDDPAVMGVWHGVMQWPDKAVHSVMLRTGKVLWYRGDSGAGPTSYTWDPVTDQFQTQVIGAGIFCSGHSVLPDGRVIATGGQIGTSGSLGPRYTVIFDPITEQWSRGPDMRAGRYYPTNLVLGDGRTLVFSGLDSTHTINEMVESFIPGTGPGGTDQWELLPGTHYVGYYPRFHLMPSGLALHVAKDPEADTFNPATGAWTYVATNNFGSRREGTSVLLPPGFEKVMIMGGGASTNTAEIIDMSAPTPAWSYTAPMKYGRAHLNNVILPDGTVLVAGGSTGSTPVLPAEIYDPATGTWREVAAMHTFRTYHSSSLLLPDGRALWAGSDGNNTAEVYSPPYLFRGPRPVIDSSATSVPYGGSFRVRANNPAGIASVVFMRPGATTHAQDMEQRYVPLGFTVAADGALMVQAPSNPNTAPPGYYMLFILDQNKVPSVAKFVRLGGTAGPIANVPPTVFAGPDQTITLPSIANLTGNVTDDGLPNPPGAVTKVWRKASGPGSVTFGDSLSATTTAIFSMAGTYQLSLSAFDGVFTTTDLVAIVANEPGGCSSILDRQVAAGADDAEEKATGSIDVKGSDLELIYDRGIQAVGLRFTGVTIPQGAVITSAYVQFMADEAQSESTSLTIHGQDADSAAAFTTATGNISSRPRTAASVTWQPPAWATVGAAGLEQRTPDLASVIQEIVDRPQWAGRSLALLITGTGHRTAESFEGKATGASRLHIEISCNGGNRAPMVNAGPDQTITFPASAILDGHASDDGLPNPPAEVTQIWSKVSGPGTVSFEPAAPLGEAQILHEEAVSASFSQAGTYVLRVTAFDGALSGSDEVTVVVQPAGGASQVLERPVASGADDAEEKASGSVDLISSDLELVYDGGLQTIGLRFTGIAIPQGATITNAWIQFMADEAQSEATSLILYGQDADNAPGFTTATRNVSLRPRTTASANWTPAPWVVGAAGAEQRTPDLSQVIQAIVGRPGWASGNALAIVITGTGHRTAEPFEGSSAPLLHIEYLPASPAAAAAATSPSLNGPAGLVPGVTRLAAVFPNPGPGFATVRFELAREAEVSLDIYDVRGALVRSLVSGRMSPGAYAESWDGRDRNGRRMANGVYLLRFAADRHREMRKLVVLEKR